MNRCDSLRKIIFGFACFVILILVSYASLSRNYAHGHYWKVLAAVFGIGLWAACLSFSTTERNRDNYATGS